MKNMKAESKVDIKDLEHRLTVKLGIMLATGIGLISAIISIKLQT